MLSDDSSITGFHVADVADLMHELQMNANLGRAKKFIEATPPLPKSLRSSWASSPVRRSSGMQTDDYSSSSSSSAAAAPTVSHYSHLNADDGSSDVEMGYGGTYGSSSGGGLALFRSARSTAPSATAASGYSGGSSSYSSSGYIYGDTPYGDVTAMSASGDAETGFATGSKKKKSKKKKQSGVNSSEATSMLTLQHQHSQQQQQQQPPRQIVCRENGMLPKRLDVEAGTYVHLVSAELPS
eukprot:16850-Heterococcus_DN1.PRE.2